jgi:four helix bundle protein
MQLAIGMTDQTDLQKRVRDFALASLTFYRRLPKTREAEVPGHQFYKAANSVRSNYRAAKRGRSRAEFISKLGVVVEECDEVVDWLEFMRDGNIAYDAKLFGEAQELRNIFARSAATARQNARRKRDGAPPDH